VTVLLEIEGVVGTATSPTPGADVTTEAGSVLVGTGATVIIEIAGMILLVFFVDFFIWLFLAGPADSWLPAAHTFWSAVKTTRVTMATKAKQQGISLRIQFSPQKLLMQLTLLRPLDLVRHRQ